ncbi:PREDICTED: translation initiation factor IF-2-like, partial [Chinchilla lanigera]|uniref:translation initiation factor IF-2-like n=1 Tax=Chinchilla lanigera TaxID=34839 RepID=UPI00069811BD
REGGARQSPPVPAPPPVPRGRADGAGEGRPRSSASSAAAATTRSAARRQGRPGRRGAGRAAGEVGAPSRAEGGCIERTWAARGKTAGRSPGRNLGYLEPETPFSQSDFHDRSVGSSPRTAVQMLAGPEPGVRALRDFGSCPRSLPALRSPNAGYPQPGGGHDSSLSSSISEGKHTR